MPFAVYVPVGPHERDLLSTADGLDSVFAYSDQTRWVVLVDDAPDPREQALRACVRPPSGCELVVLPNPRAGVGNGQAGGLCIADLVAFAYLQTTAAAFALKLDSDALVLAPFERQVAAALDAHDDAGLLGVIGDSFGENRSHDVAALNRRVLHQALAAPGDYASLCELGGERGGIQIHAGAFLPEAQYGNFLAARRVLQEAAAHGNALGDYCQGGAYVVSRRLLDAMAAADRFADPMIWRDLHVGEDVMMGLQCQAAGLRLYDVSEDGPRFGIHPGCLPFSRQALAASGYSIVHSIRGRMEEEFRAFFRERREPDATWHA
jgi:hypothetical protein